MADDLITESYHDLLAQYHSTRLALEKAERQLDGEMDRRRQAERELERWKNGEEDAPPRKKQRQGSVDRGVPMDEDVVMPPPPQPQPPARQVKASSSSTTSTQLSAQQRGKLPERGQVRPQPQFFPPTPQPAEDAWQGQGVQPTPAFRFGTVGAAPIGFGPFTAPPTEPRAHRVAGRKPRKRRHTSEDELDVTDSDVEGGPTIHNLTTPLEDDPEDLSTETSQFPRPMEAFPTSRDNDVMNNPSPFSLTRNRPVSMINASSGSAASSSRAPPAPQPSIPHVVTVEAFQRRVLEAQTPGNWTAFQWCRDVVTCANRNDKRVSPDHRTIIAKKWKVPLWVKEKLESNDPSVPQVVREGQRKIEMLKKGRAVEEVFGASTSKTRSSTTSRGRTATLPGKAGSLAPSADNAAEGDGKAPRQCAPQGDAAAQLHHFPLTPGAIAYNGIRLDDQGRFPLFYGQGLRLLRMTQPGRDRNKASDRTSTPLTSGHRRRYRQLLLLVVFEVGFYQQTVTRLGIQIAPTVNVTTVPDNIMSNATRDDVVAALAARGIHPEDIRDIWEWARDLIDTNPSEFADVSTEVERIRSANATAQVGPQHRSDLATWWVPPVYNEDGSVQRQARTLPEGMPTDGWLTYTPPAPATVEQDADMEEGEISPEGGTAPVAIAAGVETPHSAASPTRQGSPMISADDAISSTLAGPSSATELPSESTIVIPPDNPGQTDAVME